MTAPHISSCLHGVDLRFTPRCYLCRPEEPLAVLEAEPIFPTLVDIEARLEVIVRLLTSIEYHTRTRR